MGLDNVCIETAQQGCCILLWGRAAESRRESKRGIRDSADGTPLPGASPAQLLPLPVGCNMSRMRDKNFPY